MDLQLESVSKSYGKTEIVKSLDLQIDKGEFLVLLGPSGCGKSTILRLISGLEEVSGGEIRMGASAINHLPPKDRDLAMVFQSYALYPHMTVFDNMAFGLKMRAYPAEEIRRRVKDAASFLDLDNHLQKKPSELSGGQRQRVAMGRALVRKPKFFLFDEPLSNLDAQLRRELRGQIKRLHKEVNATTIYVTHDQEEAMSMADRIVILNNGEIEQEGSPEDIFNRPKNIFVAKFLGSPQINLMDLTLDADNKISLGSLLISVPPYKGKDVVLGIRPGDIAFYEKDGWKSGGDLKIEMVEALGDASIVHGSLGGSSLMILTHSKKFPREGEIECFINPDSICVFDKSTGERISSPTVS